MLGEIVAPAHSTAPWDFILIFLLVFRLSGRRRGRWSTQPRTVQRTGKWSVNRGPHRDSHDVEQQRHEILRVSGISATRSKA
jgi:hypothetical protein